MKRSKLRIMLRLAGLLKPLMHIMALAITMGVAGFFCAQFITIFGGYAILGVADGADVTALFVWIGIMSLARGLLHCAEQYSNHYIAFRLLAILRDKIFGKLRTLCPAKLECREKGSLISVITSDIELLEVFYAHTVSPAAIALIMSVGMAIFIGSFHWILGIIAACAYIFVGVVVPVIISKICGDRAEKFRSENGRLNSFVLECLYGLNEMIQYATGAKKLADLRRRTETLNSANKRLKEGEGITAAFTAASAVVFPMVILLVSSVLYSGGSVGFDGVLIPVIAMFSSFGPVIALANLGGGLQQTFAAADRVLDILDETPQVEENLTGSEIAYTGAQVENVSFSYGGETVLNNVSAEIPQTGIVGISGRSGSGKSTLIKLLMRFWDIRHGSIKISGEEIRDIKTASLRNSESYVTQDTHIFNDTIEANLRIAKPDATREEIETACRKASVHDFIMSLPQGYDTVAGELGGMLSAGEKQRIGVARAFLHDSPLVLMDEPTSSLDAFNEAVILKSLVEEKGRRAVVLVSHRPSTMRIADKIYTAESGRMS